jgi:hypothetical protein
MGDRLADNDRYRCSCGGVECEVTLNHNCGDCNGVLDIVSSPPAFPHFASDVGSYFVGATLGPNGGEVMS